MSGSSGQSTARAVALVCLATLLVVGAFFYAPQWLLTRLPVASRTTRSWLATAWIGLAFVAACTAGWRLTGGVPRVRDE